MFLKTKEEENFLLLDARRWYLSLCKHKATSKDKQASHNISLEKSFSNSSFQLRTQSSGNKRISGRARTCPSYKDDLDGRKSRSIRQFSRALSGHHDTYAVVAANTSIRLALATVANVSEKSAVKSIIITSLATGSSMKYRTRIEVVGNSEERTVLMAFATATKVASS